MRTLSKRMISALVAIRAGGWRKTGHFQGVEMRVEDLIDEDLIDEDLQCICGLKFSGTHLPTREEFLPIRDP